MNHPFQVGYLFSLVAESHVAEDVRTKWYRVIEVRGDGSVLLSLPYWDAEQRHPYIPTLMTDAQQQELAKEFQRREAIYNAHLPEQEIKFDSETNL